MLFMKNPSFIASDVSFLHQNLRLQLWLAPLLLHLVLATTAKANVYATNVRLNGGIADVLMPAATNVDISYILNEPASNGVAISIKSGAATIRTITLTNPSPGTLRGTNLDANGHAIAGRLVENVTDVNV